MYLLLYLRATSPGLFPGGGKTCCPSWRFGRHAVVGLPGLSWDRNGTSMWVSPFPLSVSHQSVPKRLTCSLEPFLQERPRQHPKKQVWLCPAALRAGSSPSRKLLYHGASVPPLNSAYLVEKKQTRVRVAPIAVSKDLHVWVGILQFVGI